MLASGLIEIFSCRTVCMLGSVIAAVGCVLSSLATNVVHLYLSVGLLAGKHIF